MVLSWFSAFLLTLSSESLAGLLLIRQPQWPAWKVILVICLGSCITHPILWFVLPRFFSDYTTFVTVGETWVWLTESVVMWLGLRPMTFGRALLNSLLINIASCLVGLILYALGWSS